MLVTLSPTPSLVAAIDAVYTVCKACTQPVRWVCQKTHLTGKGPEARPTITEVVLRSSQLQVSGRAFPELTGGPRRTQTGLHLRGVESCGEEGCDDHSIEP